MTVTGYFRHLVVLLVTASAMLGGQYGFSQALAAESSTGFPPLDQWRSAIIAGDAAALKAVYSTDPAAQIETGGAASGADADISFWLGLKARSSKIEIVRLTEH